MSNGVEWTTESCNISIFRCGYEGGGYYDIEGFYTSYRGRSTTVDANDGATFRILLYL